METKSGLKNVKNQRAEITCTEKPISNIKSRVEGHAQSGMPLNISIKQNAAYNSTLIQDTW